MSDLLQQHLDRLPHGPEFRFVDCLTDLKPGKEARGLYKIKGTEAFLRGHFPSQPLFPGVLLVEAAAQLAGILAQSDPDQPPIHNLKLAAMRQVKIHGSAVPGENLIMEAVLMARLGNLILARAKIHVEERLILEAEITLGGTSDPSEHQT